MDRIDQVSLAAARDAWNMLRAASEQGDEVGEEALANVIKAYITELLEPVPFVEASEDAAKHVVHELHGFGIHLDTYITAIAQMIRAKMHGLVMPSLSEERTAKTIAQTISTITITPQPGESSMSAFRRGIVPIIARCIREGGRERRNDRQRDELKWAVNMFGPIAADRVERVIRLVEEVFEIAQVEGVALALIERVATRVYSRPRGNLEQEIGGVAVTLEALAENAGIRVEDAVEKEWARVLSMPKEWWQKKHADKVAAGTADVSISGGCGGTPGKPRVRCNAHFDWPNSHEYWHIFLENVQGVGCYGFPVCEPCPGCDDCAPKPVPDGG